MRKFASAGILLTMLGVSACAVSPAQYVEKGNALFESGKYADAEINYQKALQKDPNLGEAYYRLGLTKMREAQPAEAYKVLSRAAELLPNRKEVTVALADSALAAYLRSGGIATYYDRVQSISSLLLKDDPKSYDGLRLQGFVAVIDRRYPEAVDLLRKADSVKPMQGEVIDALMQCLIRNNQGPEAEQVGLSFLHDHKTFGSVFDTLYGYYMTENRPSDAESLLKAKVAANPGRIEYHLELAGHYARSHNEPAMTATLEEAKAAKQFPDAAMDVGNFYTAINRPDDALREFQAGAKQNSGRKLDYQKRIAEVLLSQGKSDQARTLIEEMLKEHPTDFEARAMRAGTNVDSGDQAKLSDGLAELQALAKERPLDANTRFNLGKARLKNGDANEALVDFKEALKIDPGLLQARLLAANTSLQTQDYKEAGQYADQVLQLTGDNPMARLVKVESLAGLGNLNEAASEAGKLDRDFPSALEPKLELASLALAQKKFVEAESMFRSLYVSDRRDLRALQGLLGVYYAQNRYDAAIQFLTDEMVKNDSPEVRRLLGDASLRGRKYDLAIQQYTQLVNAAPKSPLDHMRLGDAYLQKGNTSEAVAQFEIARSLSPKDPMVNSMLALSLHNAGRSKEAEQAYRDTISLDSNNPLVKNNLAYLMAETGGSLDEALRLAQDASRLQPANGALSDTVGWIYVKKNLTDSAVQILSNVVQKNPATPVYRYHLAVALLQRGDKVGAKAQLQAALANNPAKTDQQRIEDLLAKTQ
jgi:tetratricopeptide (TPR) repeat protein